LESLYTFKEKATFIRNIIEEYNSKVHKSLFGITPNHIKPAFFLKANFDNIINKEILPALVKNDNRLEALIARAYKGRYVENCIRNCKQFLIDFKSETSKGINFIIAQNEYLYQQNLELKKQYTFVTTEKRLMKEKRLLQEERRL